MSLFVGRLPLHIRSSDLEDIFYKYGKITRCEVKRGTSYSYGFVEFTNRDDAYDAMRDTDGMDVDGIEIVVERSKGTSRRSDDRTCFRCGEEGHWARDCRSSYRRYRSRSRSYSNERSSRRRYRSYSRSPSPRDRRRRGSDRYDRRDRSYSRSRSPRYRSRSRSRSRSPRYRSRSGSRSRTRSRSVSRSPRPYANRNASPDLRDRDKRSRSRSPRTPVRSRSRSRTRSRTRSRSRERSRSRSPTPVAKEGKSEGNQVPLNPVDSTAVAPENVGN